MNTLSRSPAAHLAMRLAALLFAALACSAPAQTNDPAAAEEPSAAERAVFVDPVLTSLAPPTQLLYRFVRRTADTAFEPGFEDDVRIALAAGADGRCCAVSGQFLTGARALRLPEIDDARVNPVALFYLERAVRELQRLTGGQAAHFRRRIRLALAEEAKTVSGSAEWGGRRVATTVVSIAPFANDVQRNRFLKYAALQYVFTLSNDVPGGVLELRTRLPAADASGAPAFEEVLTLVAPAAAQ